MADDQPVVREGIGLLLGAIDEFEVVGSAADCDELLLAVRDLRPDVVLLDIGAQGDDCLALSQRLKLRNPGVGVLLFPAEVAGGQVQRALACGANGVLLKNAPVPEVLEAITTVAHGGVALGADLIEADSPGLSPREREVLRLMAAGLSNREISHSLFISIGTTKSHLESIARKLGTSHRAAAVAEAIRRGLVA